MHCRRFDKGLEHNASLFARLLVLFMVLEQVLRAHAQQDGCPCMQCGPPMCQPLCKLNCIKCCTCCVYFEARIGKRAPSAPSTELSATSGAAADRYRKWETQGMLDINKREPDKEIRLRLSVLRKTEDRFYRSAASAAAAAAAAAAATTVKGSFKPTGGAEVLHDATDGLRLLNTVGGANVEYANAARGALSLVDLEPGAQKSRMPLFAMYSGSKGKE